MWYLFSYLYLELDHEYSQDLGAGPPGINL